LSFGTLLLHCCSGLYNETTGTHEDVMVVYSLALEAAAMVLSEDYFVGSGG